MKKVTNGFCKGITVISLLLMCCVSSMTIRAQTLLAGWDFQTTTNGGTALLAAPNTPTIIIANFGSGTMYLNGTNGSSSWVTATSNNEVNSLTGTGTVNVGTGFSTTTSATSCLALLGGQVIVPNPPLANGKYIIFKFSMAGLSNLIVSYATQRTATGFNSQKWEYSTDGSTWITAQTISSIPASFGLTTLSIITGLDNAATAYLRLSGSGATSNSGNNRLDNIQLNTYVYVSSTTDWFRSKQTGVWSSASTWESSPDGATWYSASSSPTSAAHSVQIRSGHTVTVSSAQSAKLLTVDLGGVLVNNNAAPLTIADDGTSAHDFVVNGRYELYGTMPILGVSTVSINNGAEVRVNANTSGQSDNFAEDSLVYFNSALYNWNTTDFFDVNGATYFPNASATDKAVFQISKTLSASVSSGTTLINGKLEVLSGITMTFNGSGTKIFRDGLGGAGTLVHPNTCGVFFITSATAVIDGTLTVNLNNSSGNTLQISSGASVTVSGSPTINVGTVTNPGAILYIANGATLLHNGSNGISIANGALSVDGTIASSGTGTFTGSQTAMVSFGSTGAASALRFTAGGFNNYVASILIAGGSTVTLANALNIVSTGTAETVGVLNSNGFLTFKSDASGTARHIVGTGSIAGDVTVERYIPRNRAWRLLTVPFASSTQTINAAWQEGLVANSLVCGNNAGTPGFGTHITKSYYPNAGFDSNTTQNTSIKMYSANTWVAPSSTNAKLITSEPLYFLFVRGDRFTCLANAVNADSNNTVLRAKGILNSDAGVIKNYPSALAGEYIPVGNPYVSSIDLATVFSLSSATIDTTTFILWDPGIGQNGGYVTYAGKVIAPTSTNYPTPASAFIMQSGQGFFLKAKTANPSVVFTGAAKTAAQSSAVFARSAPPTIHVELYDSSFVHVDGVAVAFADSLTSPEMGASNENISLVSKGKLLAIQIQPLHKVDTFRFEFSKLKQQTYHLRLTQDMQDLGADLELVDSFLHIHMDLKGHTNGYAFTVTADTASYKHRFMLIAKAQHINVPPKHHHEKKLSVYPNPVYGKLYIEYAGKPYLGMGTITDISGRVIPFISMNGALDCSSLARGLYILHAGGETSRFTKL